MLKITCIQEELCQKDGLVSGEMGEFPSRQPAKQRLRQSIRGIIHVHPTHTINTVEVYSRLYKFRKVEITPLRTC